MSNGFAIAAVTTTLRSLLFNGLGGVSVTVRPVDKARQGNGSQLNLALYHTSVNTGWSNTDLPSRVKPGETGQPPLALNLFYLLTAYGPNDDDSVSHQLLGRAMSLLHSHSLLGRAEIKDATQATLPDSDLHDQIERVRIAPQPMTFKEAAELWSILQTNYRVSAAYQVTVVLIESQRPALAPLPVLARGPDDRGATAQGDLTPPFPALEEVRMLNQKEDDQRQPCVGLGETLTLRGHHLDGANLSVRLFSPRLAQPRAVAPEPGATADAVTVKIPNDPANLPAGFYTLSVEVTRPGETFARSTNELAFSLAPKITTAFPVKVQRDNKGDAEVVLQCSPDVLPEQRVSILVGAREAPALPHKTKTNTLKFFVRAAPLGEHFLRLRVDGVDSRLYDRTAEKPAFDTTQKVLFHD